MRCLPFLLALSALALAACTDAQPGPIDVRTGAVTVSGTRFTCTGSWPSPTNPCAAPWQSVAAANAFAAEPGRIDLLLRRNPIPIDGGASVVTITLDVDDHGTVTAAEGFEDTTRAGDVKQIEASAPVTGWVLPVAASSDPAQRNAGQLEVDFSWGAISGTYDTAN